MLHKKFIITTVGHLRLGLVNMHRDLLLPGDSCAGGGFWDIDYTANRLTLSGRSFDYGEPQWGLLSTLFVPQAYRGMTIVYLGDTPHQNFYVSRCLNISYYT